ncbi:MAG TPA: tetratricopeptide repeat protein [Polyangiaceae bacterium]|jgi:tetratricopeptide (TPR) repeat protein|nr:MAG: hypothetical protein BWY17_01665 [Deltaproteobacteria bacterium ADurb.Bin207]HNS96822.1 tetratricopeptide repeat protein [Polyangiaceae bacterium]HNZ21555.1 tetratricopeptide repeat protein [Polyangiaceae bacterium]HOD21695.1 tetratricopeptide repeat protein [Polyangiaceae bacterium]HOE48146.1 tetratricopeptide repeat protein [Polyangiaceae bacterium]
MMTKDHLLMIAQLAPNTIQAKKGDETMTRITQNVKNGRLVGLSLLLLGCAGGVESQQPARVAGTQPAMTLPTVYVTADDAGTVSVRMQKANALLLQGQWASAAEAFDRIVSLEPDGPHAPAALFNGGFAWEQIGREKEALERYRKLIDRFADRQETLGALIRASRLSSRGEDWNSLLQLGNTMLSRPDLSIVDRIEALGARGMGLAQQGDWKGAMLSIGKARGLIEEQGWLDTGKLTVGVAQVFFALGEVLRMQGEQILFDPRPADFSEALEQRCQSLLDAQDAYATAMRAYDSHWSAMAGYRVGRMYQQLHADIMRIRPPASAKTERQKELFEGAMQLRYRVLLDKGLKMMDSTIAMAQRTGESSSWVQRAKEAQRDIQRAYDTANAALAKLPFSEQDLQRALDQMAGKPDSP